LTTIIVNCASSVQRTLIDLEKQGVTQAFEFVHEPAWNVIKDFLEYEGISGLVASHSTVRESFKWKLGSQKLGSDTDFQKTGPCSRCGATLPTIVGVGEGPLTATHRQQAGSYKDKRQSHGGR
jgi:hypothetical protein